MRQLLKRILVSGFCIALSFSTLCFAVSAEEPTTTAPLQYEIDDKMECTGYTDFSNPIVFFLTTIFTLHLHALRLT